MNAISAYLTTLVFVAQQRLGKATKGATAVEYGLLVALIAAVIIVAVTLLGTHPVRLFQPHCRQDPGCVSSAHIDSMPAGRPAAVSRHRAFTP